MNFQDLLIVDSSDVFIDQAMKQGKKKVEALRRKVNGTPDEKAAKLERHRLRAIADSLQKSLLRISERFPNIDALPEFYLQLIRATLDEERFKGALASCATAAKNVRVLTAAYTKRLHGTKANILLVKRQAIGRITSVLNRLEKDLSYLEKARKAMRDYPMVKPDLFTVAIAGFPNVGKSTLLSKLTPSTPEIRDYAFTTKKLNVGYLTHLHNRIQFIDTPGTLARPEKMNSVERQAYLAMKYVANLIIYVYDLTESYPLEEQRRLEEEVRKYGKELFLFVSKTDVLDEKIVATFVATFTEGETCFTSVAALKERLTVFFERDFLGLRK